MPWCVLIHMGSYVEDRTIFFQEDNELGFLEFVRGRGGGRGESGLAEFFGGGAGGK